MSSMNPILTAIKQRQLFSFPDIQSCHFDEAIRVTLDQFEHDLTRVIETPVDPSTMTYPSVMNPLDEIGDGLGRSWGLLHHYLSVKNSSELRQVQEKYQSKVTEVQLAFHQNEVLYQRYCQLKEKGLCQTDAQKRIIELAIRRAQLGGVALQGEQRTRFQEIATKLDMMTTKFSNNVLDATKEFSLLVTDKNEMRGAPESLLSLTAQNAGNGATAENGPWKLTLDMPCFLSFMKYSENEELREKLYIAYTTRANEMSSYNNVPVLQEILILREEKARLLGFNNFAEYSIANKMASSVEEIYKLHEDLRTRCYDIARDEIKTLEEYAKKQPLKLWDVAFYSEKRRQELFSFNDEQLKPYFPLPKVLSGLFKLASRLFQIEVKETDIVGWHKDVKMYEIYENNKKIASFFLDPYSRPEEKNGGAWMNDCLNKSNVLGPKEDGYHRLPVAYICCNQSPPIGDKPSLMTFREVETLFHEFGHSLQHMLTRVEDHDVAGISGVEWDAVELPSQFMENFCYVRDVINLVSEHVETKEHLPENLFSQICAARKYMAATGLLRQLYFGYLDMSLHEKKPETAEAVFSIQNEVSSRYTIIPPIEGDRFLCSFSHIFSGGYSAGYYSYKWAEVLSCDAFSAFEEAGINDSEAMATVGQKFRETIFAKGGSLHPLEVFKSFRGREQNIDALLKLYGLM